jgi:hypothetical protein
MRTEDIAQAIDEGEFFQMQTFSKALIELVMGGLVDRETASNAASNRHDFEIALSHAEKAARLNGPKPERDEGPLVKPVEEHLPALRVTGG